MFVVTKTHNFDPETEATLFDNIEDAISYLQWIWEDYYNREILEGEGDLLESECYHEEDYAKVTWEDKCVTEFHLMEIVPPRKEFMS